MLQQWPGRSRVRGVGARREDTFEGRNPSGAGVWAGTGPGPSGSPRQADELRQRHLPLPLSPARRSERGPFKNHVNKALVPRPPPLAALGGLRLRASPSGGAVLAAGLPAPS